MIIISLHDFCAEHFESVPSSLLQLLDDFINLGHQLVCHLCALDLDQHHCRPLYILDRRVGDAGELDVVGPLDQAHLLSDQDVEEDVAEVGLGPHDHLRLFALLFEVEHSQALLLEFLILLVEQFAP